MIDKCDRPHVVFVAAVEGVVDGAMEFCCKYHKEGVDMSLLKVPMPKFLDKFGNNKKGK